MCEPRERKKGEIREEVKKERRLTWMKEATQKTAKMMYVFHWILRKAGGTNCG